MEYFGVAVWATASKWFYKREFQEKYFPYRAEAVRGFAWHSAPRAP
jgi:hypothetical protein